MAKRLIWSKNARMIRHEILKYWKERNKSSNYSKKLNQLFDESAEQIQNYPYSGIQFAEEIYRGKLIRDYYLIYSVHKDSIKILLIWDTRQNPEKLIEILGL